MLRVRAVGGRYLSLGFLFWPDLAVKKLVSRRGLKIRFKRHDDTRRYGRAGPLLGMVQNWMWPRRRGSRVPASIELNVSEVTVSRHVGGYPQGAGKGRRDLQRRERRGRGSEAQEE